MNNDYKKNEEELKQGLDKDERIWYKILFETHTHTQKKYTATMSMTRIFFSNPNS